MQQVLHHFRFCALFFCRRFGLQLATITYRFQEGKRHLRPRVTRLLLWTISFARPLRASVSIASGCRCRCSGGRSRLHVPSGRVLFRSPAPRCVRGEGAVLLLLFLLFHFRYRAFSIRDCRALLSGSTVLDLTLQRQKFHSVSSSSKAVALLFAEQGKSLVFPGGSYSTFPSGLPIFEGFFAGLSSGR